MRDLLRLRLTGRLDLDAKLAAPANADLPLEAKQLIRETVKKTRLWKLEKADVADELIAHFRDGQTRDADATQLVENFGDPKATAPLIRRAKKRNRSFAAKAYVWTRRGVVLLVAFYLLTALRFYSGSPTVSVDYLAQINADAAAVAAEDQAWPIYREALIGMHESNAWDDLPPITDDREDGSGNLLRPGDPGWPAIAGWLNEHRAFLDALREGGQKPGLGLQAGLMHKWSPQDRLALYGPDEPDHDVNPDQWSLVEKLYEESMVNILLTHLGILRRSTRLLVLDSYAALEENDSDRVTENLLAMIGHAHQSAEHYTLTNGLVGVYIHKLSCETLTHVLQHHPDQLRTDQLQRLAHALAASSPRDMVKPDGERFFLEDLIQRTYTDDGKGNGHLTDEGVAVIRRHTDTYEIAGQEIWLDGGPERHVSLRLANQAALPVSLWVVADRRETLQRLDELMSLVEAEFQQTMWRDYRSLLDDKIRSWTRAEQSRFQILFRMMPAMGGANRIAEQAEGRRDGVLLGIALELYRREHSQWPTALADLTPRYLPDLPIDRITGSPLHYRVTDDGPVIYSVGGDRDDDDARVIIYEGTGRIANHWAAFWDFDSADDPERDGDWVIYPWPE